MKMIAASLRVLIVASIVLPLATTALAQETKPAGDPVNGKKLFLADGCYQCHGTFGQGGGRAGPKLAPNPIPAGLIMRQLRRPSNNMPIYTTKVLSDAQAGDIIVYLQSVKADKPSKDIPLLNVK
jgi:mono/diheme cytochrome c family protein